MVFSVCPIALLKNRIRIVILALMFALEFVLTMTPASGANFTKDVQIAKKFGTHEIVLNGTGLALNPFDTIASVTFTPPSGPAKDVTVRAFYDGGNTWRARVYVNEAGIWVWKSSSLADPELNGKSG
jgi:hypothetical protein